MLNSKIKNKIYMTITAFVFMIAILSFILSINFFIYINKLSLNTNENIIKENTTLLDIDRYNRIKNKLEK
ncbi:MAG: hypothetical protein P1P85_01980 [Patescibacteria group bacterium]|nr:hypothetical protein [Patescibacteria group bacterium]